MKIPKGKRIVSAFSRRADTYHKYRWDYPWSAFEWISSETPLSKASVVVDVGSGTGMVSGGFLKLAKQVIGIEPSPSMALIAAKLYKNTLCYNQLIGTSNNLPLKDSCADLIIAGQAVHYFDPDLTGPEFSRVLKANGKICIIHIEIFPKELYSDMKNIFTIENGCDLELSEDKPRKVHISYYFNESIFQNQIIPLPVSESFEDFFGGLCSSADAPLPHDKMFGNFKSAAHQIFEKYRKDGQITLELRYNIALGQKRNLFLTPSNSYCPRSGMSH